MPSLDYDKKLSIDIQTLKFDIATLPPEFKETSRILLKFLVIDPCIVDNDIAVTLFYKRYNTGLVEELTYNVQKDEERFKQKLPIGINSREFWVRVHGFNLQDAEIGKISVLGIPKRIGNR